MSLNETLYAVNIYEQNYTGNIVQLIGSDEPFVTMENEDDNIFHSVRNESGYLRVINNDNTLLESMMPANNVDKMVKLITGKYVNGTFVADTGDDAIKWQGFIQARMFTQDMFHISVLEFPINDALGLLSDIRVYTDWLTQKKTFVELIVAFFDELGLTFSKFVIQSSLSNPLNFLTATIDTDLFIHVTESDEGVILESDSYEKVFSAMLQMFGMTARMQGNTLYFAQYDNPDIATGYVYTIDNLRTIISGGSVTPTSQSISIINLFDAATLAGTNNKISFIPGIHKAIVELQVPSVEKELTEIPLMPENQTTIKTVTLTNGNLWVQGGDLTFDAEENAYTRTGNALSRELCWFVRYDLHFNGNTEWYYQNGISSNFTSFKAKTIITDTVANIASHVDKTVYTGSQPARFFYASTGSYVSLLNGFMLQMKHVMESDTLVQNEIYSILSRKTYTLTRGVVAIDMNSLFFLDNGYNANTIRKASGNDVKTLWFSFKFGNKYWNGSSWQNDRSIIKMYFDDNGSLVVDNSTWQTLYNTNIGGYWMPIPSGQTMNGAPILTFYDQYGDPQGAGPIWAAAFIYGINIKYAQCDEVTARKQGSNIYNLIGPNVFKDEKKESLTIGTYNNNTSSTVFVYLGGSYMQKLAFRVNAQGSTTQYRPENHLLARIWQNRHIVRQSIKLKIQQGIEMMHSVYSYKNRTYMVIRSKTIWRDAQEEVKLLEI